MTKLLDCQECDAKQVPVIDSAEVCSPKCRQRKKRRLDKQKATQEYADLFCGGDFNKAVQILKGES